ncbi:hypothetical protein MiSe_47190 [Microseira wollei NIES-4236]|uniref:Uncharacterized protein n=1 Tax=Microseira wollei NIES-4236 TaxID=2530354 RepID=A0AAV3XAQ8_9CYAN|nr:hypothetical protein MiSe_47190 [Microseira wollei NIES-4236]
MTHFDRAGEAILARETLRDRAVHDKIIRLRLPRHKPLTALEVRSPRLGCDRAPDPSQQSAIANKNQNHRPRPQRDFYCDQDVEDGDNTAAEKRSELSVG